MLRSSRSQPSVAVRPEDLTVDKTDAKDAVLIARRPLASAGAGATRSR